MPQQDPSGRWVSDDGRWWWDGAAWQPSGESSASPIPAQGTNLEISRCLEDALRTYRSNLGFLVKVATLNALIVVVAIAIVGAVLAALALSGFSVQVVILGAVAAGLPLIVLVFPLTQGALYHAATQVVEGRTLSARASLAGALRKLWSYWTVTLVMFLALIPVITCVGILLTIWLEVLLSLALPVLFAENATAAGALGRSWDLVKGNWWRVFLVGAFVGFVIGIINEVANRFVGALWQGVPGGDQLPVAITGVVIGLAVYLAMSILTAPVGPLVQVLMYRQLRALHENRGTQGMAGSGPMLPAGT